jgi:hypothetical protein
MSATVYHKGKVGQEDVEFGRSTFTKYDSNYQAQSRTQIHDGHLPLADHADRFLRDLFDQGYDVDIYPRANIPKSSADATMSGHETFAPTDGHVFWRDPDGANRNFNPSGTFIRGHVICLFNTADAAENITFDSAGLAQDISQNERGIFVYNGSSWTLLNFYSPESDTTFTVSNNLTSDHTSNGIISSETVGEDVVFGEVLYQKSDGKLWKSDADAFSTMPVIAMAAAVISADGTGNVLKMGYVRDDSWNWTVGGLIFASTTGGALTQTAPSGSGDQVQALGYAYSADIMYFNPSMTVIELP